MYIYNSTVLKIGKGGGESVTLVKYNMTKIYV